MSPHIYIQQSFIQMRVVVMVLLLLQTCVVSAQLSASRSVTASPSSFPSHSVSRSISSTASITASMTASASMTPTPFSFACPGTIVVEGAGQARPSLPHNTLECFGRGTCVRNASSATLGSCSCEAPFEGVYGACESCPVGQFQRQTCGGCEVGSSGQCFRNSDAHCVDANATGMCPPGFEKCVSSNRSNAAWAKVACNTCPGVVSVIDSHTNLPLNVSCSGHGGCNQYTGRCYCDAGFAGDVCDTPTATFAWDSCDGVACSGNGVCVSGQCLCSPGFVGVDCALKHVSNTLTTPFWYASPWGECSRQCGGGVMQRNVMCYTVFDDFVSNVRVLQASDACNPFSRPSASKNCRQLRCNAAVAKIVMNIEFVMQNILLSAGMAASITDALRSEVVHVLHKHGGSDVSVAEWDARVSVIAADYETQPINNDSNFQTFTIEIQENTLTSDKSVLPSYAWDVLLLAVSNTSSALHTETSLLRRLAPLSSLQYSDALNASMLQFGIVLLNITQTSSDTALGSDTLLNISVGLLAGVVVGVGVGVCMLGYVIYRIWLCSIGGSAKIGVAKTAATESQIVQVAVPDGKGGLDIVDDDVTNNHDEPDISAKSSGHVRPAIVPMIVLPRNSNASLPPPHSHAPGHLNAASDTAGAVFTARRLSLRDGDNPTARRISYHEVMQQKHATMEAALTGRRPSIHEGSPSHASFTSHASSARRRSSNAGLIDGHAVRTDWMAETPDPTFNQEKIFTARRRLSHADTHAVTTASPSHTPMVLHTHRRSAAGAKADESRGSDQTTSTARSRTQHNAAPTITATPDPAFNSL